MKTNKTTAVATKSTKRPTPEGRKMKAATKITKEDELAVAAFRAMDNIDNNPAEIPMEDDEIARRKLVNAKFHALDKSATLSQFLDVALQRILEASK